MEIKTVGLASDHAGYPLKQFVLQYLEEKGYPVKDYGTYSDESVDYPDFAHPLAEGIESGEVYPGIAICGSGEGMAITLNKHQGVRAGLAWNKDVAQLTRQHNDANVIVLPGRFIDNKTAASILDAFFTASFEGGRHERRFLHGQLRGRSPRAPREEDSRRGVILFRPSASIPQRWCLPQKGRGTTFFLSSYSACDKRTRLLFHHG